MVEGREFSGLAVIETTDDRSPVVLCLPAFNESGTIEGVIDRAPASVCDRDVRVLVVDDGSTDDTAAIARNAGAEVLSSAENEGLGAAVRKGLSYSVENMGAAAVAFCDADGEYFPEDLETLVKPILQNEADYVVGSRFEGRIDKMLLRRRMGNWALTKMTSLLAGTKISDRQSGYRALSAEAARGAEIRHDYNYAQVLTLNLLSKNYRYKEVPIRYSFREKGESFIRLGQYLRNVLPTIYAEIRSRGRNKQEPRLLQES